MQRRSPMAVTVPANPKPAPVDPLSFARAIRPLAPVTLLLDYDGTLVPFASRPELAAPDQVLLDVLDRLASLPGWQVHIVSGRLRADLDKWFGSLDFGLHAEHGAWSRMRRGEPWERTAPSVDTWPADLITALRQGTSMLPGSFLELKSASIAFHFREVRSDYVASMVPSLERLLQSLSTEYGFTLLAGAEVLEVTGPDVSKARAAARIICKSQGGIVAMGDDAADEELFASLPRDGITIRVGAGETCARYRLAGPHEVRVFLSVLADSATVAQPEAR